MDFYRSNFAAFVLLNGYLAYRQHKQQNPSKSRKQEEAKGPEELLINQGEIRNFKYSFFPVYLLVMGADWLQGPFIYTLYKYEKKLSEEKVAALFMTGFLSAACTAYFVGSLADKYGRKTASLAFCVVYAISCITVLSDDITILFVGRALGGIGTTLLYTIFEAWMVTEYYRRELDNAGSNISGIFGAMTTLSSIVAILAGVAGESLVEYTLKKTAPFVASTCCLIPAFLIIFYHWNENYGESLTASIPADEPRNSFKLVSGADKKLLTLGLTSCFFEGSMYLFIFFWSPALVSAHGFEDSSGKLPFGLIFASFMGAMMLGSILFTIANPITPWLSCGRLLMMVVLVASGCLLTVVFVKDEWVTFWAFCLFEICVGVYYPTMASQKGKIVDDGVRAKIYGILRIPLNLFVVLALLLTKEGEQHRDTVFQTCSGLLLLASAAVYLFLV